MDQPLERPAESAGVISDQLAAQERTRQKAIRRVSKLRQKASAEIERLILFLDASDPYVMTELEDASEGEGETCEDEGADIENDGEPSLGFLDHQTNQSTRRLCQGLADDREDEHDGREPDVDDEDAVDKEPAFGWTDEEAARGSYPNQLGS